MDMEKGFAKDVEPYNPGKVSGNIFADSSMRRSPIEDLNAEGFLHSPPRNSRILMGKASGSTTGGPLCSSAP